MMDLRFVEITIGFFFHLGFIMMTPQLFINYKLKSVAHLPWRMLTYKALNTFIDDIFAFVIKMPTMYRIGCFRDDIVFFIFLYQRYIYRVSSLMTSYIQSLKGLVFICLEGVKSFQSNIHVVTVSVLYYFQVDLTRVNEFGYSGDMLDDPTKAVEGETSSEQAAITHSNGDVPKSKADKKKD